MTLPNSSAALKDLTALTDHGPRFHGTAGIHDAADWLESRLAGSGLTVRRQAVTVPDWTPGGKNSLSVLYPVEREMPVWPMLWSGASNGPVTGTLHPLGPQGIWGDSITWQRFVVEGTSGETVAYVHARDTGPAAPQPLPHGSDLSVPHLVVGRIDGLQLREWAAESEGVTVRIEGAAGPVSPDASAVADNLIVDIRGAGEGTVLLCAHYDTFYNTAGAYDNGSGTIALLHLAQEWAMNRPIRSVRIVWFTAEEWHLGGSRHYVDTATDSELDAIDYVVNVDGLGRGAYLETFSAPEEFGSVVQKTVNVYADRTGRVLDTVDRFPPTTGTDDASFYRAGVPSMFLTFNDMTRLHQPNDLPNEGIASNIAWTTGLIGHLIALPTPRRVGAPGIL